jgi:hypothetical protein
MNVRLLWLLCVVRQRSLRRADHSSRGVLPTAVRRCVWYRNLVNKEDPAHWGLLRARKKDPHYIHQRFAISNGLSAHHCPLYLPTWPTSHQFRKFDFGSITHFNNIMPYFFLINIFFLRFFTYVVQIFPNVMSTNILRKDKILTLSFSTECMAVPICLHCLSTSEIRSIMAVAVHDQSMQFVTWPSSGVVHRQIFLLSGVGTDPTVTTHINNCSL